MKKIIIYLVTALFSLSASAQDITVNVEYPSVVSMGQQFTVTWTVNTGGGEFSAPAFTGFMKLLGPQTSYSSSTEIINGKISQHTSYSYVYYLQPVKEGKFVISPAVFTYKNKTYTSESMFIEVTGNGSGNQNTSAGAGRSSNEQDAENAGSDIYVKLSLDRKEVYLGEHIVATVKLYTRVNLSGINEVKYPPFDGFLKADLQTPPLKSLKQETINGKIYGTGVVQQFLLYPQMTGEISIDPVQVSVLLQQKVGKSDPFFGDFFSAIQTVPKVVASLPVKVTVKPLPGVKPAGYSGVVGSLDIKATINKDTVNINDPVNFNIAISGSGNLKVAATPSFKLPPDIEVYDPKITDNLKNNINGTSGQKSFEYLLIPRHNGDYTIPPVTYSYFNSAAGRYENLTTRELHFHVRKGNEQSASGIAAYGEISREDVKYLGKDIRFIKSDPGKLTRVSDIIYGKRSFYSIYAFAALAFLVILFLRREHIRRNSDITIVRNRKAATVAGKRLHIASLCLKNEEIDEFYEEILKALWGYLSDKLNIPVSELTRTNAINALSENGIDQERLDSLTNILDTCEFARYAPSSTGAKASEIYEGASQFIRSVENSLT